MIVRLVLSGSRAASRDLDGNILIWDLNDALTQNYNHEGNLLRSIVIWSGAAQSVITVPIDRILSVKNVRA